MKTTKLKGGSLNQTTLFEPVVDDGYVAKRINRIENREYGFVRWYSQLKKHQLFESKHCDLVPKLYGVYTSSTAVEYTMEYLNGYMDAKTFLLSNPTNKQIVEFFDKLETAFLTIHNNTRINIVNGLPLLYFYEEVKHKIDDALSNDEFRKFVNLQTYTFNGIQVKGLCEFGGVLNKLETFFSNVVIDEECLIHGNPTLENIMYCPETKKVKFIDLYDESIINIKFLDFAQVLQCSNSLYGPINDSAVIIDGSVVNNTIEDLPAFKMFNDIFTDRLKQRFEPEQLELIKVLEATQFIRMLPFKCLAGDLDHAKYFYVHASYMLQEIFK